MTHKTGESELIKYTKLYLGTLLVPHTATVEKERLIEPELCQRMHLSIAVRSITRSALN